MRFAREAVEIERLDVEVHLDVRELSHCAREGGIKGKSPRPIVTRLTMKAMEERLPADRFLRVHKSFIVGLQHLSAMRKGFLRIGAVQIPVCYDHAATWADSHAFAIPNRQGKELTPDKRKEVLSIIKWFNEHSLAWGQMESAPQTQRRAARPFGENRAHAERPRDFVTNDQSTERR